MSIFDVLSSQTRRIQKTDTILAFHEIAKDRLEELGLKIEELEVTSDSIVGVVNVSWQVELTTFKEPMTYWVGYENNVLIKRKKFREALVPDENLRILGRSFVDMGFKVLVYDYDADAERPEFEIVVELKKGRGGPVATLVHIKEYKP